MKKSKFLFPMDLQTFAGGEESVALTLLNEIVNEAIGPFLLLTSVVPLKIL